jgi:hypothetical protein
MNDLNPSRTSPARLFAAGLLLAVASSALADVRYVDVNSTNATPPDTNWTTAATDIQDAVDAAVAGDEIVVTNGIYAIGGRTNGIPAPRVVDGYRVVVDKPLNLRSAYGAQFTIIDGGQSLRCAYLTNSATMSGFTLTNGVSFTFGGGGVWCASSTAVVSNCVISGNQARTYLGDACGGGAYGGTLDDCMLTDNAVRYVNSDFNRFVTLTACGGGAAYCTLNRCSLSRNAVTFTSSFYGGSVAQAQGGGAAFCTLNNCTLIANSASAFLAVDSSSAFRVRGGGASNCTLNNCTLTGNSAAGDGGCSLGGCREIFGGGAYAATLNNCISFGNTREGVCEDCYSPGLLAGNNWYIGDPLFVDTNGWANLRLQSDSPCINAGNNTYVSNATDLDGNPRIAGGTVDIGAYEFQSPVSRISYAWLQQFNLPINPSTDTADPDGDGVDNYHEWLAGTDPTNLFSSPAQLTIIPSGTNAVGFTLQSTTNLVSPVWSTNSPAPVVIGGQNVVTNPLTGPQQFYRLIH